MPEPVRKLPYKPRLSGAERRELIENAAAKLFAERGYVATTLDDVASAAGVSRPVVYDHFANKQALHEALVTRHLHELMAHIAARLAEADAGFERRFRVGIVAFFEFMESDPYAWRITMREPLAGRAGTMTDPLLQREMTGGLAAFLQQEIAQAGLELDPADRLVRVAESLRWVCAGLASWWWDHRELTREEVADTVIDLCWTGLEQLTGARPNERPRRAVAREK